MFHSFDKVTSLFIHIMPCVTLHALVHLLPPAIQEERFPAIWDIKTSPPGSPTHYSLLDMTLWSTIPYAIWQLSYHFLITVRRREKIAAGRPTSFTWLRKSYSKVWIGKLVLALPESLQEVAFMLIQYTYAVATMLPCPLWFWYRYMSAAFLMSVFCWSVYNGATYYIVSIFWSSSGYDNSGKVLMYRTAQLTLLYCTSLTTSLKLTGRIRQQIPERTRSDESRGCKIEHLGPCLDIKSKFHPQSRWSL